MHFTDTHPQSGAWHRRLAWSCGALLVLAAPACAAAPAHALLDADQVAPGPVAPFALPSVVARAPDPLLGRAADSTRLGQQRGGSAPVNNMQLDGAVRDNSATNVVTGANTIDAGSFANMTGIPMVIQNSGANVLIQNATIINLQFK